MPISGLNYINFRRRPFFITFGHHLKFRQYSLAAARIPVNRGHCGPLCEKFEHLWCRHMVFKLIWSLIHWLDLSQTATVKLLFFDRECQQRLSNLINPFSLTYQIIITTTTLWNGYAFELGIKIFDTAMKFFFHFLPFFSLLLFFTFFFPCLFFSLLFHYFFFTTALKFFFHLYMDMNKHDSDAPNNFSMRMISFVSGKFKIIVLLFLKNFRAILQKNSTKWVNKVKS